MANPQRDQIQLYPSELGATVHPSAEKKTSTLLHHLRQTWTVNKSFMINSHVFVNWWFEDLCAWISGMMKLSICHIQMKGSYLLCLSGTRSGIYLDGVLTTVATDLCKKKKNVWSRSSHHYQDITLLPYIFIYMQSIIPVPYLLQFSCASNTIWFSPLELDHI